MKELVEMIVKALVDQPDAVEITEIKGNHAHVIELNVAKEEVHPRDHRASLTSTANGTVSERVLHALAAVASGVARPEDSASDVLPPLWLQREELLQRFEPEGDRQAPAPGEAGARVWDSSEPWLAAVIEVADSPGVLLAEVADWAALLDRHSVVEIEPLEGGTAVTWDNIPRFDPHTAECEFRRGALAALLADDAFDLASVAHTECRALGARHCVFAVEGLRPASSAKHARLLLESSVLSGNLQGRAALFRRLQEPAGGPLPDPREFQMVRRFMEEVEDIILIFDPELCVLDANRAATRFSGMSLEELRGQSARELLGPDSYRIVWQTLPALFEVGSLRGLMVEGRTRDGWVPLELSARVSDAGDAIVVIGRDISQHLLLERELEELNRQLRAQNERIREADNLKSEFLANVSHELGTPLTCIRGFTRLLSSDLEIEESGAEPRLPPDKRAEFLRIIHGEAERMGDLIRGLLELSKIESGVVKLDRARLSVGELIEECVGVLGPRLREAEIEVERSFDGDVPDALVDPDQIKQVALNLLDNAIKFSPPRSRVRVRTAASGGMVEFAVRNRAEDLSSDYLNRLFERFVQRDGSFTRRQGGVGLGLDLVRAIVELHGGKVWAELPEPGDVEFVVRLPLG